MAFELRCDGQGAGQAESCRKEGPRPGQGERPEQNLLAEKVPHSETGQRTVCPGVGSKRGWHAGQVQAVRSQSRDAELRFPQGGRKQGCDEKPGQASLAAWGGVGGQGAGAPALRTSGMRGQILGENTALTEHLSGVHRGVTGMRLRKASDQRWDLRPQG